MTAATRTIRHYVYAFYIVLHFFVVVSIQFRKLNKFKAILELELVTFFLHFNGYKICPHFTL